MTETGLADYEIRDRLVMLGNDTEAQKAAIRKGAASWSSCGPSRSPRKSSNWPRRITVRSSSLDMAR